MNNSTEVRKTTKENGKHSFNLSKEENGIRTSISGEEVENGWVTTIYKSWEEPRSGGGTDYKSEDKKYISTKCPLDDMEDDSKKGKKDEDEVNELFDSVLARTNDLVVD